MRPGLSVIECVRRRKRYHYAFVRLHQIFPARIPAEPLYELNAAFSLHAYTCAEHVAALRTRVGEMREPPLGLDEVPDPNLELFFDEILGDAALRRHLADTTPLADYPPVRLCRMALPELEDVEGFGSDAVAHLLDEEARQQTTPALALLERALGAAGSLDGVEPPSGESVARLHSKTRHVFEGRPRRDARLPDPYSMGVNAEAFVYGERYPAKPKTLMMYYKRLREIGVPEVMASIITEPTAKDWECNREMSRQLWDEARHSLMGLVGFTRLGVDWRKVMVNFTWSLGSTRS